jgi:hypothetical protein
MARPPLQLNRQGRKARETRFRCLWRQATNYGQHPPSEEFSARMPELLAAAQREDESDQREIAADTARAAELLRRAEARRPCEQCLRPASPCQERCLRSLYENPALWERALLHERESHE